MNDDHFVDPLPVGEFQGHDGSAGGDSICGVLHALQYKLSLEQFSSGMMDLRTSLLSHQPSYCTASLL